MKWLCGGPGAGYLYVRPDLAAHARSRRSSAGRRTTSPFEFATGAIRYAGAPERFQSGTPNVPSLYSARAGYEIVAAIGVPAIRERSLRADAAADRRAPAPPASGSTRPTTITSAAARSSSTSRTAPAVADELIRRGVIVDYRPGAGIRMAPHFYNTEAEIDHAIATLRDRELMRRYGRLARIHAFSAPGTMGHGIAHAAIAGGYETRHLRRVGRRGRQGTRAPIEQIVKKGVELGKATAADADAMLARLRDDREPRRGARRTPTS